MTMTQTERGWLAGVLDGEGYFSIYSKGTGQRERAMVRINQAGPSAPLMMDKLVRLLGGNVHTASRLTAKGKVVVGWAWQSSASHRTHLPLLIPHLTVKRAEAEVLLAFAKTVRAGQGNNKLNPAIHEQRAALAAQMLALRKVGQ